MNLQLLIWATAPIKKHQHWRCAVAFFIVSIIKFVYCTESRNFESISNSDESISLSLSRSHWLRLIDDSQCKRFVYSFSNGTFNIGEKVTHCLWRLFLFIFFCCSSSLSRFNSALVSTWINWHIYGPIKIWFVESMSEVWARVCGFLLPWFNLNTESHGGVDDSEIMYYIIKSNIAWSRQQKKHLQ